MRDAGTVARANYRPDIDGLRALSVAGVVLFHAEVPGVAGGFVGVDVFFVISGYLIAQWLMVRSALPAGALLREFYVRRARRILPALLLMLGVAAVLAWLIFLPTDLVRFGKYLLGAVLMTGNFAAWTEGDYFNSAVGFAPLLHLWSIAVEEQFYLLFPLLMLALRGKTARRQVTVLAALASMSFVVCVYASYRHPVANFYLGPTRAWELLLGALLAYGILDGAARRFTTVLAATGLFAVLAPMVVFHRELHYPGLATLVPALGAAGMIVAGRIRQTPPARLLASSPCVIVGRASYSIYLWHLPPLIFATYYLVDRPTGWARAALLTATLCVAFAAWLGFEEPLRSRRWLGRNGQFLGWMGAAFAVLAILGASWWRSDGHPENLTRAEQRILASAVLHPDAPRCMQLSPAQIAAGLLCRFGTESAAAPSALLWGDSHALALLPAFESLAKRRHLRLYFAGTSACRPLPGFLDAGRATSSQSTCAGYNDAMRKAVAAIRPDVVILSAFWAYPGLDLIAVEDGHHVSLREAFQSTTLDLARDARRVCLVRDVPVLRHPVPYALIMSRRRAASTDSLGVPDPEWLVRQRQADAALTAPAAGSRLTIVDPTVVLCPAGRCRIEDEGEVLFRDSNHLSVKGAGYVAGPLAGCLVNLR